MEKGILIQAFKFQVAQHSLEYLRRQENEQKVYVG